MLAIIQTRCLPTPGDGSPQQISVLTPFFLRILSFDFDKSVDDACEKYFSFVGSLFSNGRTKFTKAIFDVNFLLNLLENNCVIFIMIFVV